MNDSNIQNNQQEPKTVFRRVGNEEAALVEELIGQGISESEAFEIAKAKHTDVEKLYIALLYPYDEATGGQTFVSKYSRREIYDFLKENIEKIDIHKSFLLTDESGLTLEQSMEMATVYKVMQKFQAVFVDTTFDIESYNDNNI